jgi:hypothetical protein
MIFYEIGVPKFSWNPYKNFFEVFPREYKKSQRERALACARGAGAPKPMATAIAVSVRVSGYHSDAIVTP